MRFIDSVTFMASSLSNLVDNLAEVDACLTIKITQASLMKN